MDSLSQKQAAFVAESLVACVELILGKMMPWANIHPDTPPQVTGTAAVLQRGLV